MTVACVIILSVMERLCGVGRLGGGHRHLPKCDMLYISADIYIYTDLLDVIHFRNLIIIFINADLCEGQYYLKPALCVCGVVRVGGRG